MITTVLRTQASIFYCCLAACGALAQEVNLPTIGLGVPVNSGSIQNVVPPVFDRAKHAAMSVDRVTGELIELLNDESASRDHRQLAIATLQGFKRPAAVVPLLNHLLFRAGEVTEPGPLMHFPAARALAVYGSTVYPAIWGRLARECSDEYLYVLAATVHCIDGTPVAFVRVKGQLVDPEMSPEQKLNLRRLLDVLNTTDFQDPLKWPKASRPKPVPAARPNDPLLSS